MAEFVYGGNWEDSWSIVDALLERDDLALLADLVYQEPRPIYLSAFRDNSELQSQLKERRWFYIAGKKFSHHPPQFVRREGGSAAGTYWIDNNKGGPFLSLTLPACYIENGITMIGSGSLVYYDEYRNPKTGQWEKPSPALISAYKEIKALLKKYLVRHKLPCGFIWIGRNALSMLQNGTAQLANFLPQRGLKLIGGKVVPDPARGN